MESAEDMLQLTEEEADAVSRITVHTHRPSNELNFYEEFALRGIRVDRIEPGFVACTFKVPPRLMDRTGNLSARAIANIVDEFGAAAIIRVDFPMTMSPSVNMSISYVSTARVDDMLDVTSRLMGQKGNILATVVLIKNKTTGKIVAEGHHSLFRKHTSKIRFQCLEYWKLGV